MAECTYELMEKKVKNFFKSTDFQTRIIYDPTIGYMYIPINISVIKEHLRGGDTSNPNKGALIVYAYYQNASISTNAHVFTLTYDGTRSNDREFEKIEQFENYLKEYFTESNTAEHPDHIYVRTVYDEFAENVIRDMRFEPSLRYALSNRSAYRQNVIDDRLTEDLNDRLCAHVISSTNRIITEWIRNDFGSQFHPTNTMQRIEYTLSSLLTQ